MIICHSRQFIFIHINKCGGTSVTRALEPFMTEEDIVLGGSEAAEDRSEQYLAEHGIYKHATAAEVRDFVGKETWNRYYTFAFTRNPWDKIVSTYFWFHKSQWNGDGNKGDEVRKLTFNQYLKSRWLDELSCSAFLYDGEQKLVDDSFDISQLDAGLGYVCGRSGLPLVTLPRNNATEHQHYSTYYPNKVLRGIIEERYADDIRHFGYSFDSSDRQQPDKDLKQDVDFLRDLALRLEKEDDIATAYRLMSLAQRGRPDGPLLSKKLAEYQSRLDNEDQTP